MKKALIYPSTTGERFVYRRGEKTKCLTATYNIGRFADTPTILTFYEYMNRQELTTLYQKAKKWQLDNFRQRMPEGKQGVEFVVNGRRYIAAIRRLTPQECARLQTVPDDYQFITSDTQQYRCLGNGWTIEVIKHIFSFLPEERTRHLKVLSLFDGMSGGQIALRGMGIKPDIYLASEIDKHAIANTQHNFPDTIQMGSVTDINVEELVGKYGVPDMLIGGSPCQSFSFSGKMNGMTTKSGEEIYTLDRYLHLKGKGFRFEGQSYLFWEYMRILTELRKYNPGIFFLLENVRMLEKWERCLSHAIGIRGVHINSALVSAQNRRRIYWSNIRTKTVPDEKLFADPSDPFSWPAEITDIPQPSDRGLVINDIIQQHADDKYYLSDDTVSKILQRTDTGKLKDYLLEPQVSSSELLEFMESCDEYSSLTEEEKTEISMLAYEQERRKLHEEMSISLPTLSDDNRRI